MTQVKISLYFDKGTLIIKGYANHEFLNSRMPGVWKWDARNSVWRGDALHYRNAIKEFKSLEFFRNCVPGWENIIFEDDQLHKLRKEQENAVECWRKQPQGVIVMPTGTGKTEVSLKILQRLGKSTLIVTPVRDLMYQWHRRIKDAFGYNSGILGDGQHEILPVTVTTYDSACIYMKEIGDRFELIIFDECHHLPGDFYRESALMCAAPFRLGLTATPKRSDGRHVDLERLIGPEVFRVSLKEVKGKSLAEYDVVRIPIRLSPSEQKRYDYFSKMVQNYMIEKRKEKESYSWRDLLSESSENPEARRIQKAFYSKQSIEDRATEKMRVLEDIFRLHYGSRIIVFAGSNAMARDISLRFLIPCLLSHCKKEERYDILHGFAKGKYPAIVANRVLDEGVDVPEAKVAVVLGGLGSSRQAVQRLGRVLRKRGNEKAALYEVVCEATREVHRSRKRRRHEAYDKIKRTFITE